MYLLGLVQDLSKVIYLRIYFRSSEMLRIVAYMCHFLSVVNRESLYFISTKKNQEV